jgi:hypothetical protein
MTVSDLAVHSHLQWHVDIPHVNIAGTFHYLRSMLGARLAG